MNGGPNRGEEFKLRVLVGISYHVLLIDSRTSGGVYEKNFFPSVSRNELVAINNSK